MAGFERGSRYRNVPVSTRPTPAGAFALGVNLRVIPLRGGRFEHVIHQHERLDLLAYRYYNDPGRWWQIADANPRAAWPPHLLDRAPFLDLELFLSRPAYFEKVDRLVETLAALGSVERARTGFDGLTLSIGYPSEAVRTPMTNAIAAAGLRTLGSHAWSQGPLTWEAFLLADDSVTKSWNRLMATLAAMPGVEKVAGDLAEERIAISINRLTLTREGVQALIQAEGFAVRPLETRSLLTAGQRIVIPPDLSE